MIAHTPGPWIFGDSNRMDQSITTQERIDALMVPICEIDIFFDNPIGPEQEANANLIAAAPDLLAALQEIVKQNHHDFRGNELATAAIAKATGDAA